MAQVIDDARPILEKLHQNGFQAYVVGGAVRDLLLGKEIHDVDIATSALPETVMSLFEETIPTGLQHGTVMVVHEGKPYEVTTFRSEKGYSDHRHPDTIQFESTIEADLARRDFTINAMALSIDGSVIDPYRGKVDLQNKQLETVGAASERFQEDPLRMLRAARFISQLNFSPSRMLVTAIEREAEGIQFIAMERIREELTKCLRGVEPFKALQLLAQTGLSNYIYGLSNLPQQLKTFSTIRFDAVCSDVERWSLFFYLLKVHLDEAFLQGYRFSKNWTQGILKLVTFLKSDTYSDWTPFSLYQTGIDLFTSAERLNQALGDKPRFKELEVLFRDLPIKSRSELAVNGRDLLKWTNQQAGPWVNLLLIEIEKEIILKKLDNSKETIRRWVQSEWMRRNY